MRSIDHKVTKGVMIIKQNTRKTKIEENPEMTKTKHRAKPKCRENPKTETPKVCL